MSFIPLTIEDIDAWTDDTDTGTGNMFDAIKDAKDREYIR